MAKNIRQKAFKYFVIYMILMLFGTIVSRGIYAYQMPQVTLGSAEAKKLTHEIEAGAVIEAWSERPLNLLPGLLVSEVLVREGQKIENQDVLLLIDTKDLEELKKQSEEELAAAQTLLSDYQRLAEQAKNAKASAVSRANQDLADTAASTDAAVAAAENERRKAQETLDSFPSREEYLSRAENEDSQYQRLREAAAKEDATDQDKDACKAYRKALRAEAANEYEAKKEAARETLAQKEAAVSAAAAEKDEELKQAGRAVEDAKMTADPEQGAIFRQKQEIQRLLNQCEAYQALLDSGGEIRSEAEGYVSRILTAAGERTAETAALLYAELTENFLFTAYISSEDKRYVNVGDSALLSFASDAAQSREVVIDAAAQAGDGSYKVSGAVSAEGLALGESGVLRLSCQTKEYSCCIPLSALHGDGGASYVMLAEEQDTILGKEWTAKKRKVKVLEEDGENAALEDASVTDEEKLITDADREIADRERIRLAED